MLALPRPSSGPVLSFGVDTFAFRNDSRIYHRDLPDIYCNRCFLMARRSTGVASRTRPS
jgi:hypothetical protein